MNKNLLIADGDAELCDLYRQFFTEHGYEVKTSSDGLDCLAKLRQLLPAVLVLDPELHWGGGEGVLAWLREDRFMPRMAVIITATAGYPQVFADCDEPLVMDYLPKPFTLCALLEKVRSALTTNGRREPNRHLRPARSELYIG